jgi:uncharacterized protein
MAERHTIPARKGLALRVRKGQRYKVVNTHGTQIVDHWAFNAGDVKEFMSMEHCRVAIDRLSPLVGDAMVTNKRRPIITLLEDTSPGVHDTLVAACDIYRYRQLGAKDHHDNCTENLWDAMKAIGLTPPETPCPFNLFQNTQYVPGKGIQYLPTVSKPGQYVIFRPEMDAVVLFSACPQDMLPVNSGKPTEAHVELL